MCTIIFYSVTLTLEVEILTLLITFEQWVLELGYFTWIFPLIKPFCGYHNFWPCNHDLGVWHTFKNCNLANKFWTVSARALIFKMNIPCDKTFPWAPLFFFYLVTFTLEFDPFFENFNLANNFWTVNARALIFHMNIPCDKTCLRVPSFFTLWPWPWC